MPIEIESEYGLAGVSAHLGRAVHARGRPVRWTEELVWGL
jgi:hypothetical protein